MKSPAELASRWARQWQQADTRESRLLDRDAWPIELAIGKPAADVFAGNAPSVREHVRCWRAVSIGQVDWESVTYRSAGEPVELPVRWRLRTPTQWIAATGDPAIRREFDRLDRLVRETDPCFRRLLVRQLSVWRDKTDAEVKHAARLALALSQGCAAGRPLRSLSIESIDTKFLERHRRLVVQLLDVRFDGVVGETGLEAFLGASDDADHWLLLAPLSPGLLPFAQQRVRTRELESTPLPGSHVLIVENERCLHQLPTLPDTVAVLGAGLDLDWLRAPWLHEKRVGYWGDMDSWGMLMLGRARNHRPDLDALLMSRALFDSHPDSIVVEPVPTREPAPETLHAREREFYEYLRSLEKGRLEQEFLPQSLVSSVLDRWRRESPDLRSAPFTADRTARGSSA